MIKMSEEFLKQNPDLLTEEITQALIDWCLSEEVDNVSILQFMKNF
jgi:hypothetical protein